jgi:hypothetical protein
MNMAQHTVKLIRTGSRIYLSVAGLQALHISILLTGAEYPYFGFSRHITMGSIAAKIHMPSMQFPNRNSTALCCTVELSASLRLWTGSITFYFYFDIILIVVPYQKYESIRLQFLVLTVPVYVPVINWYLRSADENRPLDSDPSLIGLCHSADEPHYYVPVLTRN